MVFVVILEECRFLNCGINLNSNFLAIYIYETLTTYVRDFKRIPIFEVYFQIMSSALLPLATRAQSKYKKVNPILF